MTSTYDPNKVKPLGSIPEVPYPGYQPGKDLTRHASGNALSDRQIDDLYFIMQTAALENMSTMKEEMFVKLYLPVLSGTVDDEKVFHNYVTGSGGLNMRVRIIDDAGQTLFTVPPLLNTASITPTSKDENAPTYLQICDHMQLLSKSRPNYAVEVFKRNFIARMRDGRTIRDMSPMEKEWADIFKRYGYDIEKVDLNAATSGNPPTTQSTDTGASVASEKSDDSYNAIY